MESVALKEVLQEIHFDNCLEIGCGTGKNTVWLTRKAKHVTGVDFSEGMLDMARKKIFEIEVEFVHADITHKWDFSDKKYDLVTFSLVLEHIENLDYIFAEASKNLYQGGFLYLGELHPFKQYTGSKARFDTDKGLQVLDCYIHNISDFINAAQQNGFSLIRINEYFDDNDKNSIPRLLAMLLKKDRA